MNGGVASLQEAGIIHYAWVIAFTGALVLVLSHGFGRMSYPVILESMKEGLSFSYLQVGLVGTGNFIGYLFLALVGGFLAARFGARKVLFFSLLVMGVSLFLTGLSDSFAWAFVTRLITGMGNGGSYIPMMALPAAWFVAKKRGLATGIITLGTGTGMSITGLILPRFIAIYGQEGWRYAWYLLGGLVFAGSFVCYALLRDRPAEKGVAMYGGEDQCCREDRPTLFTAWKAVTGEKEVWKLGCVYFMYGFSYIMYLTFIVAYLTKEAGFTGEGAGDVFALLGLASILCGVVWGGVSDIIGRRYAVMSAYVVLAIANLVLVCWKSVAGVYVSAALFGITAFSVPVIMAAAAGDVAGPSLAPAAIGFITIFFGIGQALGPGVAGWLKDTTGAFGNAFVLSACVSFMGAGASWVLNKRKTAL